MRPSALPVELGPGPFTTAEARRLGVPAQRLGRSDLVATPPGTALRVVDVADTWCDLGELRRGSLSLHDLQALTLVRPGVRSPMETRARLMFVDAGFPEPEVNAPVTDAAGEWLAEGDLVWRGPRVVGEYQGEQHAGRRRRSSDAFRQALAEAHDWRVKKLWAEDLHRGPRRRWTLTSLARALDLDPSTLRIA